MRFGAELATLNLFAKIVLRVWLKIFIRPYGGLNMLSARVIPLSLTSSMNEGT